MRGKLFSEVFGIVDSIIPKRTNLVMLLNILFDKNSMAATNLDTVVKVTFNDDYISGETVIDRDSIKSSIPAIKKSRDVTIRDNKIIYDDVEQVITVSDRDKYPEIGDLAGMGDNWSLIFDTSEIHFTNMLLNRLVSMAKGIAKEDYRADLMGYIFDPEEKYFYTTNGHMLFGTCYSSVAANIGNDISPDTILFRNISPILKKMKNVNTMKMENSSEWVRFTFYCDAYIVKIATRKTDGNMKATTIRKIIPVERGDNTIQLSTKSIDKLMSVFSKTVTKGVKFSKVENTIECTEIGSKNPAIVTIQDEHSSFEDVGFNITYLKDICDFYECDLIEFNFMDNSHAVRANIFDNDDIAIVMPVRLSN